MSADRLVEWGYLLISARDLCKTAAEYVHAVLAKAPDHRLSELEGLMVRQISRARTARGAGLGFHRVAAARAIREAVAALGPDIGAPTTEAPLSREEVVADLDRCLRYDVAAEARLHCHDLAQRRVIAALEAELATLRDPEAA